MMSSKICANCNKEFKSVQGLLRHKSRKTPCDKEEFKCYKCNKVFSTEKYLKQHFKRKTPCNAKKNTISLEEQKEMLELQTEAKLKILNAKRELIEMQKEIIELQYKKKKDLIEMQKEKDIAIEEEKSKRKSTISHQTIINNIIQQVNINMPASDRLSATYNNCIEDIVKPFINRIENGSYSAYELVYASPLNKSEIATHIIHDVFQNDTAQNKQNIVYITEHDLFMVVLHKAWVYKQFDYLANIMTDTFKLCFSAIKARIGMPLRCNFLSDAIYAKARETYAAIEELAETSISAAELEQISKDGLNIDDILSGKKMILLQ